jgi:hypothetical protein
MMTSSHLQVKVTSVRFIANELDYQRGLSWKEDDIIDDLINFRHWLSRGKTNSSRTY